MSLSSRWSLAMLSSLALSGCGASEVNGSRVEDTQEQIGSKSAEPASKANPRLPGNEEPDAAALPFSSYAPPFVFGPWQGIRNHIGRVTFRINYEPVGDTLVVGEVKYWKNDKADPVIEGFVNETTITTSNSIATVYVHFKGVPFGSAVYGTVFP